MEGSVRPQPGTRMQDQRQELPDEALPPPPSKQSCSQ